MRKHLTRYSTGGEPGESCTTEGVRMREKTGGAVAETGDGGKKRRKLEDENVQVSSSSSSCIQLRSGTVLVRTPDGEKKLRKSDYSVETANCGEGAERNRELSRCSSNSSGDCETRDERYWSRSGDHNQESKEKEEDAYFESESCNLRHYHCDSEGGEEGRRREWTPSSDPEENCDREENDEEEEEELDNLDSTAKGVNILSGHSSRPKKTGRKTRMVKSSSKMPSQTEIEEFFTAAENDQTKKFMEKYNFDLVNDVPVEGRYDWVKLNP